MAYKGYHTTPHLAYHTHCTVRNLLQAEMQAKRGGRFSDAAQQQTEEEARRKAEALAAANASPFDKELSCE